MLHIVEGDIVNDNYSFFCQQVNCKGVMGAGLAKQIVAKYPAVLIQYKQLCLNNAKLCLNNTNLMGHIQLAYAESGINPRVCVNLFAQYGYGRDNQYTNYDMFQQCLNVFRSILDDYAPHWTVAFPYGIGCGLAGGDWNVIFPMIQDFANKVKQEVFVVKKVMI